MKILQMILLMLPVLGAWMMATLIWKSLFVVPPLTEGMYAWLVVLLLPFGLAFFGLLQCLRLNNRPRQILEVLRSILLGAPAAIGLIGNWNGEVIALLPIYLWPVTAIMTFVGTMLQCHQNQNA